MKKIIDALKKFWVWSGKLTTSNLWIFGFPTAIFVSVTVLAQSILMTLVLVVWIITLIHNTNEAD